MIELFLDDIQLEVPQDIGIGLTLGIADYADPITASGAFSQTMEIPRTPHNDRVFNFSGEILSPEHFNNTSHTARILEDGCELVGGKAFLDGVTMHSYRLQVVGAEVGWVENIRDKKLSELKGDGIGYYQPTDWGEVSPESPESLPDMSFVLLDHGCWWQEGKNEEVRRKWVTYNDLIPIVKLHTLLAQVFKGYDIEMSDRLRRLLHITYCTMKWKSEEKSSIMEDDFGFELTSELKSGNSEGELAITLSDRFTMPLFDTIVEDKGGHLIVEEDGDAVVVKYDPQQTITASLELKTKYQTSISTHAGKLVDNGVTWEDVEIYGHTFADQIVDIDEPSTCLVQYELEDSLEWSAKQEAFTSGKREAEWKPVSLTHSSLPNALSKSEVMEASSPNAMPLAYVRVGLPSLFKAIGYYVRYGWSNGVDSQEVSYDFFRPSKTNVDASNLVRCNYTMKGWRKIRGLTEYRYDIVPALLGIDDNIYIPSHAIQSDGEINSLKLRSADDYATFYLLSEDQRLTFDVAFKMPAKRYDEGSVYDISTIGFGCSRYDRDITVYGTAEGSLKTVFEQGVPARGEVKISDIGGDAKADDILRSIMQMYDLLIYTNPYAKKVNLYTFAEFWDGIGVIDWRSRIDSDSEISVASLSDSIGKEVILTYANDNPRIEHYNKRNSLPYFAYKAELPLKATTDIKEVQNALLTPAYMVSVKDAFGGGSGYIPTLASADSKGTALDFSVGDIPMTAMLVDMNGTAPTLPLNTSVFGDIGPIQPTLVATIPGDTTLSFADKEGTRGLNRYYNKHLALWQRGKRLTCYCRIEAWEIESLRLNDKNFNFLSWFRLNINGEDILARLESVEYEPTNTTNKCTFIIE